LRYSAIAISRFLNDPKQTSIKSTANKACSICKIDEHARIVGQSPSIAEFPSSANATDEGFSFWHVVRSFWGHGRS
jgi:hypothetical protein